MSAPRWLRILTAMFLIAGDGHAEEVVRVTDGDSLVVDSGGREVDVRLADIDAPELDQPHGKEARSALSALVSGREIRLDLVGGDAYRRIVARVFVEGHDVAQMLVHDGHAWVRRAYAPESELIPVEDEARTAKRGLWADPGAVPPWIWRRSGSPDRRSADGQTPAVIDVQCGARRYCAEMRSCDEALAYLRQCDLKRLDGDGDGVPCENLCGYNR